MEKQKDIVWSVETADVVVIGAGPGGLAAAVKARQLGAEKVVLLERNPLPGGILNQCIHDGFGLVRFGKAMSGPEYAARFIEKASELGVDLRTESMVLELTADRHITYISRSGLHELQAGAVILATGCRERTRGALAVPGKRPAGVYTAGVVQYLMNIRGISLGKKVVIMGSGDIGLIMARRLTLEGAEVLCVLEKLPYCSGLARNVQQCLRDYNIPLCLAETVCEIRGGDHVTAVVTRKVDEKGQFIPGSEREIACDTLVLSVGLIPENELAKAAGIRMDPVTSGALTDANLMTSAEGIFSCGNGLHVHDLVDMVSEEGERAAQAAVSYARNGKDGTTEIPVENGQGIRYVLPRQVKPGQDAFLSLRVTAPGENGCLEVRSGEQVLLKRLMKRYAPAEMQRLKLHVPENAQKLEVIIHDA